MDTNKKTLQAYLRINSPERVRNRIAELLHNTINDATDSLHDLKLGRSPSHVTMNLAAWAAELVALRQDLDRLMDLKQVVDGLED